MEALLVALLLCLGAVRCDEQEYRLTKYLMSNYDPAVRPAFNASQPLKVSFDMALYQILDVDEKNQILVTNAWLTQKWVDVHLRWNASDFGGISVIRLPASNVWKPDIVLYNSADAESRVSLLNTNVIVQATGDVLWPSAGLFRSVCGMNVEYFPFDVQTCTLKFASWAYDGSQLDVMRVKEYGDFSEYQSNGEFDLDEFTCYANADVTYVIKLRRRPMFYVLNLIVPCLLINGIALFAFYVPSESGEKITLSVHTLLSLTVFLMLVQDSLPHTQQTPLISLYYGITLCLVSFATGFSVLTLNVHYKGHELPSSMRRFILGFVAKIVFASCTWKRPEKKTDDAVEDDSSSKDEKVALERFSPRLGQRKEAGSEEFERHFLRVLNKVYESIERHEARWVEQERKDNCRAEWQQVALICDRFLLGTFLLATLCGACFVLLASPYLP